MISCEEPERCARVKRGQPYTYDQCRVCWLVENDPRCADLEKKLATAPMSSPERQWPCAHRGGETGERMECPSCPRGPSGQGKTALKLFECSKHGVCDITGKLDGYKSCQTCGDWTRGRDPFTGEPVLNLLYHIYPIAGNARWQWNVGELLKRMPLFNGKRLVSVVTDGRTDSLETVKKAFLGERAEFQELPNDPNTWELVSFPWLFESVQNTNPNECTLYAHAKSVTHATKEQPIKRRGVVILRPIGGDVSLYRAWTDQLYKSLMDYWPLVQARLEEFPLAGSFRLNTQLLDKDRHPVSGGWHYSGSWFWFRNKHLYRRKWRSIPQDRYGIENYPAQIFSSAEAGVLFAESLASIYEGQRSPTFEAWEKANVAHRKTWERTDARRGDELAEGSNPDLREQADSL
jgi:hypothetical protein